MKRLLDYIDKINAYVGKWVVLMILPMMGVLAYEVLARFFFNRPTVWAIETTTLIFGLMVSLLGGYTMLHDQHVRVDVLFSRWSDRGKAIADTATSAIAFFFVGTLFWYLLVTALASTRAREVSETVFAPPLYPFRIVLAVGVFLLLLQMIAKLARDVQKIRQTSDNSARARSGQ